MPCTRPILTYKSPGGAIHSVTSKNQYHDIGYEMTQWTCKKCPDCKAAKARDWGIRLGHHASELLEHGIDSSFVTLTYDEEHIQDDMVVYGGTTS